MYLLLVTSFLACASASSLWTSSSAPVDLMSKSISVSHLISSPQAPCCGISMFSVSSFSPRSSASIVYYVNGIFTHKVKFSYHWSLSTHCNFIRPQYVHIWVCGTMAQDFSIPEADIVIKNKGQDLES